jgi:hypothetical protein
MLVAEELMAMAVSTYTDARVLRDFRDLFGLTLDDVEVQGISRATWARIEQGLEISHRPGVARRIAVIRSLMEEVGKMSYRDAREWATRPLRGRGKSPSDLVKSSLLGLNTVRRHLAAQQDFVAS